MLTACWRDNAPEEGTPYRPPITEEGPCGGKHTHRMWSDECNLKFQSYLRGTTHLDEKQFTLYTSHTLLSSYSQSSVLI